jgi:hypothetical protein
MVETNQAYANSGIGQRVRLVYRDEVSYAETGSIELDLQRLQNGGIPSVHAWRNQYAADIVSLWVENGGAYCGIGYQLTPINAQFEPYAVNVVARVCATGNYSFGHEMGHNMGACHDRIVNDCRPANTYGYGYVAPGNAFRTIMSYASSCGGCPRIPYFSSSTATYQGQPVGAANFTDNRRMLDDTAATVANFRQCVVAPCGVPPTAVPTAPPVPTATPIPTATPTATPTASCSPRQRATAAAAARRADKRGGRPGRAGADGCRQRRDDRSAARDAEPDVLRSPGDAGPGIARQPDRGGWLRRVADVRRRRGECILTSGAAVPRQRETPGQVVSGALRGRRARALARRRRTGPGSRSRAAGARGGAWPGAPAP